MVIDGNTNDLSLNGLPGGTRISFVFHELFNVGVKSIDPFDQVKDGDIRTTLRNSLVRVDFLCRYSVLMRRVSGRHLLSLLELLRLSCEAADKVARGA